jgi:hypothetical protein
VSARRGVVHTFSVPRQSRHARKREHFRRAVAIRGGFGRRRKDEPHVTDFGDPAVARRWRRRWYAAISVGAAGGITWYALEPGVASYQIGYTLALPAIITVTVWVGKRLPRWLDWILAIALAAGGMGTYVLTESTQWWVWAQAAALPLVLLIGIRGFKPPKPGEPPRPPREPWYGGMSDGPWGPP